ncbi:hypothetical protein C8J57DRAFT_1259116 [Mycena rebaudengoi]|nr:hypothetical protein C8J57DRAFT_1259116 [Mycena rebaudengoi]
MTSDFASSAKRVPQKAVYTGPRDETDLKTRTHVRFLKEWFLNKKNGDIEAAGRREKFARAHGTGTALPSQRTRIRVGELGNALRAHRSVRTNVGSTDASQRRPPRPHRAGSRVPLLPPRSKGGERGRREGGRGARVVRTERETQGRRRQDIRGTGERENGWDEMGTGVVEMRYDARRGGVRWRGGACAERDGGRRRERRSREEIGGGAENRGGQGWKSGPGRKERSAEAWRGESEELKNSSPSSRSRAVRSSRDVGIGVIELFLKRAGKKGYKCKRSFPSMARSPTARKYTSTVLLHVSATMRPRGKGESSQRQGRRGRGYASSVGAEGEVADQKSELPD